MAREFTENDRLLAFSALEVVDGDVVRAAKLSGVPKGVINRWLREEQKRNAPVAEIAPIAAGRPVAPAYVTTEGAPRQFVPGMDLLAWLLRTFVSSLSPLYNEDHEHLEECRIGVLWTNVPNIKQGRRILAECERPYIKGKAWKAGREEYQICQWFGDVPEFILTFDAHYAMECSDAAWCAVCEHELYHCGQRFDEFGSRQFDEETGLPLFTLRAHDIEEFSGVARRYGAVRPDIQDFANALDAGPTITRARIAGACGTCLR